jgi:hypothetical protein
VPGLPRSKFVPIMTVLSRNKQPTSRKRPSGLTFLVAAE